MYFLDADKKPIEVEVIRELSSQDLSPRADRDDFRVRPGENPIAHACRFYFQLYQDSVGPMPLLIRQVGSDYYQIAYREIIVRFRPALSDDRRLVILAKHRLRPTCWKSEFAPELGAEPLDDRAGAAVVDLANELAQENDVVFAEPNLISQIRRAALPIIPDEQWHLHNKALVFRQKRGADLRARAAWRTTQGSANVVVAVIDDGVDVDHPALTNQMVAATFWRDFSGAPDPYNPRPKDWRDPRPMFQDAHGTCCAGLIAARDLAATNPQDTALGIAFGCHILPVKVFFGAAAADPKRVAEGISYAAHQPNVRVLSMSFDLPRSAVVQHHLKDVKKLEDPPNSHSVTVFCSTGNSGNNALEFPASDENTVAVGACTDKGQVADYSNYDEEDVKLAFLAPSNGGALGLFTTDATGAGAGFSPAGAYTDQFSGTSGANALAAGVAGLVLSMKPGLSRAQLYEILKAQTDKIGGVVYTLGRHRQYGYGRLNAAKAVAAAKALP